MSDHTYLTAEAAARLEIDKMMVECGGVLQQEEPVDWTRRSQFGPSNQSRWSQSPDGSTEWKTFYGLARTASAANQAVEGLYPRSAKSQIEISWCGLLHRDSVRPVC
jgi:hypothetical protein